MIEFQAACLGAPAAALIRERAAATVPLEDRAQDRVGNVARGGCDGVFARDLSRSSAKGEALLLPPFDQQVERLFDDGSHISVRDPVPEEILSLAKLVTTRAAAGELKLERLLSQRRDDRPALGAS